MILDVNSIAEFSRANCGMICAFLVPMNLIATLQTMIFTAVGRSQQQMLLMVGFASLYAGVLVAHVWTWFAIGVVMAPTFILLFLAAVCVSINIWAIAKPTHISRLIQLVISLGKNTLQPNT
ncbi:hypothetical protein H4N54_03350 [Limnospira fusiformis KN01]|uniref:Uncharacterized protein n=3 Tax=Limnospira TaxID=2596745 RepID=A0A9P1P0Y4_9CYAN|nr:MULTISPECIES: hypothetical protein [Limnospira]EKD08185.1 hypothetical protein SPLC1_S271070 [Arthrospira platensis C1]MDC0839941.1 hypothetical protein [Limnoraphis robusta]MDY7055439.1 hypothetical protein [Limnospira fusiformis LS22]QJB25242.1 hypothetical protein HFV01_04805 [Limnospira fusiformis SAG 85.79]MDT9189885.1 hypothetical protein [Limnospira sp. PMC 894.15]